MGTTPPRNQPALACIANPLLVTSALIGAIALAWWGHSAVNFGYPVLYDALAIDDHIAEYGPQNRYKAGFEDTSRTQRLRLFDRMVGAINSGGDGLAELTYRPAPEAAPIRLLRDKEVVHLNAVADLVTLLHGAGGTAVGIFLVVLAGMRRARLQLPWQAPWWSRDHGLPDLIERLVLALCAHVQVAEALFHVPSGQGHVRLPNGLLHLRGREIVGL